MNSSPSPNTMDGLSIVYLIPLDATARSAHHLALGAGVGVGRVVLRSDGADVYQLLSAGQLRRRRHALRAPPYDALKRLAARFADDRDQVNDLLDAGHRIGKSCAAEDVGVNSLHAVRQFGPALPARQHAYAVAPVGQAGDDPPAGENATSGHE